MEALEKRLSSPFDIQYIYKKYGSLDYVGLIMHPKFNNAVYVYYQPNPKRELGHTEFFGLSVLTSDSSRWYIVRLTGEEVEAYQWHNAKRCLECSDVVTSLGRHDYRTCQCGKVMMDGGSSYLRTTLSGEHLFLNTLTGELM